MSWVADAKAAMINRMRVNRNIEMWVSPDCMTAAAGWGRVKVSSTSISVISICMVMIHHRLVFTTSTMGLQIPFRNHGK